jgi:hypothetical protein
LQSVDSPPPIASPNELAPADERTAIAVEPAPPKQVNDPSLDEATLSVLIVAKETLAPVPGVQVMLGAEPTDRVFILANKLVTDTKGRVETTVPVGLRLLLNTREGSEPCASAELEIEPLVAGETRHVDLTLATQPDVRFVARAVSEADGQVLTDASMTIGPLEDLAERQEVQLENEAGAARPEPTFTHPLRRQTHIAADDEGYMEVVVRSWRGEGARFNAPGHAWVLAEIGPGHETRANALEVVLVHPAALDVLVLDWARRPLQGCRVRIKAAPRSLLQSHSSSRIGFSGPALWEVLTDAEGRARLEGLPPRVSLSLATVAPSRPAQRAPEELELQPGEVRSCEVVIGSGATISGSLLGPDGSPKSSLKIWLQSRRSSSDITLVSFGEHSRIASTDEQGNFHFDDVLDGAFIVGLDPKARYASVSEVVIVERGVPDHAVHLVAYDLFLRGVVFDPDGKPCGGANVSAYCPDKGFYESGESDASGRFALGPLLPGTYGLGASVDRKALPYSRSLPQTATAGAADIVLTLRSGGRISCRVVDAATGEAISGEVEVIVTHLGNGSLSRSAWSPSQRGEFLFGGLEPGLYGLAARSSALCGVLAGVQLTAGEDVGPLTLALRPGGRMRLHYCGLQEHAAVHVVHDGIVVATENIARGSTSTVLVPPGSHWVDCQEWTADGTPSEHSQQVAVGSGETVEVRLEKD